MVLPELVLINYGRKLTDDLKNRWVSEHVEGNLIKRSGCKLKIYNEGRIVGLLNLSVFMMYRLQGLLTRESTLLDREDKKEFQIKILEAESREDIPQEQE